MIKAENSCRFTGKLKEFKTYQSPGSDFLFGRGIISLPDENNGNISQDIKITSGGDIADRLSNLPIGSWIMVLTSYMPSTFKGRLQDQFHINALWVVKHD